MSKYAYIFRHAQNKYISAFSTSSSKVSFVQRQSWKTHSSSLFPFTSFVSTSLKQHLFFPRDNQVKPFNFSIQKHVLPRENPHRNEQMEWPAYLIVIILSPVLSFCLSISMCAPVHSRIALMLHPPLPMTLDMTVDGTETFLDLYKKKQH